MTLEFPLIDPDATPAENVGCVLSYLDEREHGRRFEREQAAGMCERHRTRILRGNPPLPVLHAVERDVAPSWVVDVLRRRFVVNAGSVALASVAVA